MKMTLFNCRYSLYLSLSLVKALHTLSRKSPEFWTENGAGGHSDGKYAKKQHNSRAVIVETVLTYRVTDLS